MKGKVFTAQEVQAILNGSKVMFREVIKHPANWEELGTWDAKCPYQVGQKIFCKEKFLQKLGSTQLPSGEHETFFTGSKVEYVVDGAQERWVNPDAYYSDYWKKRPAQHMKQEHSRLTLLIKEIRVERLASISEEDAIAEGFAKITKDGSLYKYGIPDRDGLPGTNDFGWAWADWQKTAKEAFAKLWNATHKKPEDKFEASPWVWCVSFEVINN